MWQRKPEQSFLPDDARRAVLQKIAHEETKTIRELVAKQALKADDLNGFFDLLLKEGCEAVIDKSFIYYPYSHKFFERHYEEIEALRRSFEEHTGANLTSRDDLKTDLVRFALKETGRQLVKEVYRGREAMSELEQTILERERDLDRLRMQKEREAYRRGLER